jgi:anti-sigma regulatory factor (Ser/Thr protein kinase)
VEGFLREAKVVVGLLAVSHDPANAAVVRHSIAADLAGRDVTAEGIDDVVLVASELVSNAVVHATGDANQEDLDVAWDVQPDCVVIRVVDGSPDLPHRRSTSSTDTRGRGLSIVAALALDWGVKRTASGKQVWARVPIGSTNPI